MLMMHLSWWIPTLGMRTYRCQDQTHLSTRMAPVSTAVHVASTSSVHVPSVHWAASVHVSTPGSHVTPHRAAPGGSAQAGNGTATAVIVSTAVEGSSEGWGRQEATRWAVETTTRARSCRKIRNRVRMKVI